MLRVVVSDTSPLRYLVLIGQADLLPRLYTELLIPETVAAELNQPRTPAVVRDWLTHRPDWLKVVPLTTARPSLPLSHLDAGERDAILLALGTKADLLLMDEREGVEAARSLGLTVTGTLGVLDRAAERGWIELEVVIPRLRQSNFRMDPGLLDRLLAADHRRRKK
jgi:predicted nucleic acid-binding protein